MIRSNSPDSLIAKADIVPAADPGRTAGCQAELGRYKGG
jgi:hypothetical protein